MLKRLARDKRGVSAVEFALIAPIMILLYFGLAELTMVMMAQRRASHVASAVGDLVTQNGVTSVADIGDIFTVADAIIAPFPTAPLSIRLTSIKAAADGSTTVVWSQATGPSLSALAKDSPVTIPAGLIEPDETIVQAEAKYVYDGSVKYVIKQGLTFNEKFYLRPRKTEEVSCADCVPSS